MSERIDTEAALKHFETVDRQMATLLRTALLAPQPLLLPTLKKPSQYFASIVNSIISQQISVRAADTILGRVKAALGTITPERVLEFDENSLRQCGLSGQKAKYIRHNAAVWHTLPIKNFKHLEDEAVIAALTELYGIGRWTAEMFLMFSLARPDVFSRGDLGLMQGIFMHYPSHRPHHTRKIETLIKAWSPHRTTAALTLWFHKDNGPVLL